MSAIPTPIPRAATAAWLISGFIAGKKISSFRPVQAFFRSPCAVRLELLLFGESAAVGILIEKLLEVSAGWRLDRIRRCILLLALRRATGAGKLCGKGGELRVHDEQKQQDQHQHARCGVKEEGDVERKGRLKGSEWHGVVFLGIYGGYDLPVDEFGAENLAGFRGFCAAENGAVLVERDGKAALEGGLRTEGAEHVFETLEILCVPGNALRGKVLQMLPQGTEFLNAPFQDIRRVQGAVADHVLL